MHHPHKTKNVISAAGQKSDESVKTNKAHVISAERQKSEQQKSKQPLKPANRACVLI
jgi:hypothetical protein